MSNSPASAIGAIDAVKPAAHSTDLSNDIGGGYGMTVPSDFQVGAANGPVSASVEPSGIDQLQDRFASLRGKQHFLSSHGIGDGGTVVIPVGIDGTSNSDIGQAVVTSFVDEARLHDQRTKKMMDSAKQGDGMTLAKSLEIQTDMALRNNRMVLVQTLVKKAGQTFQDIVKAQ